MNNEMKALFRNNTWVLADLPVKRKTIGCKWLFKIKYKYSREIKRYKVRLVAKGFSQREGIDYDETFNLVVKLVTVRCIISLDVHINWSLFQLDVNNSFLYSDLHEDVYMDFPLDIMIIFLALLVYVDDIVVTGNNSDEIEKFKVFLASKFQINDLSSLKYFLGIEVLENKNGLSLSQRKYCLELMCDYGLLACKPAAIPMQQNISLNHVESEKDKKLKIHCLSRHMRSHFSVGLRVLKYLKMSLDAGNSCQVSVKNLVSWKSKKQENILRSSTEAEYICMASTTCEVIWLTHLLKDLNVEGLFPDPLYCDSTSVIQIAANLVFHKKTKHFKIDVHLVRDKVASGVISTVKVNSANQVVDIFTKCLSIPQHKQFCEKLNMVDMFEV
ncbi:ribonuclease H-like domain-containing protein [Tanacetum coccineum]